MEHCRFGFLWFFLAIFLLLHSGEAENRTDPTDNVNLSPFWGWRSAYWCLKNASTSRYCQPEYVLKEAGWPNVTVADAAQFCGGGCASQTKRVLKCIHYVKRDYWFADRNTVENINATIDYICSNLASFNGTSPHLRRSGASKKSASIVAALSALASVSLLFTM